MKTASQRAIWVAQPIELEGRSGGPGQNTSALDDGSPCLGLSISVSIIRAGTSRSECALIKRPAMPTPRAWPDETGAQPQ